MSKRHLPTSGTVTAVEINGDWIKVVQAEHKIGGTHISGIRYQQAPGEIPSALAGMIRELGGRSGHIVMVLPRQMVTVRMLEFPSLDPREIADMIELQVSRQTPYSRDEIICDYKILGVEREGYSRVMLVIAPSHAVRQRYTLLEEAGLDISRVTISTEGVLEWAAVSDIKGEIATLDIDYNYADFCVFRNGMLVFTRSIAVGGAELQAQSGDAETRFFHEVRRAVEGYRGEISGVRLEQIVLTGAISLSGNESFIQQIRAEMGVPVEIKSTWSGSISESARSLLNPPTTSLMSLVSVIGAAVGTRLAIDLTPEAVRQRHLLSERARRMTHLGILVMALVGVLAIALEGRMGRVTERLRVLQNKVSVTENEAKSIDIMKAKAVLIARRIDTRFAAVRLMAEIQSLIPASVFLTTVQIDEGKRILLRGNADSTLDVIHLVKALGDSPLLENAKSTRTASAKDKTEFEIVCETEVRP